MRADSRKLKRAGGPRSKTGCGTCRQRRTKCDERTPICGGCLRLHLYCTGWPSQKPSKDASKNVTDPIDALDITIYQLPYFVAGGPKERKALHYFFAHASKDLSGTLNEYFWEVYLPQRSQGEALLRQTLVALSYAHLDYCTLNPEDANILRRSFSAETYQAYGKVLKSLRRYLDLPSPSRTTVLLCCLLLYEVGQIHGDAKAIVHIDNGLEILAAWKQDIRIHGFSSKADEQEFQAMNWRVLTRAGSALLRSANTSKLLARSCWQQLICSVVELPEYLTQPAQCRSRNEFEVLYETSALFGMGRMMKYLTRIVAAHPALPSGIYEQQAILKAELRALKVRAYNIRPSDWSKPPPSMKSYLAAMTYICAAECELLGSLPDADADEQRPWDKYAQRFLQLARVALKVKATDISNSSGKSSSFRRSWSAEFGIKGSLMMLSRKTSLREVREEACALIEALERDPSANV